MLLNIVYQKLPVAIDYVEIVVCEQLTTVAEEHPFHKVVLTIYYYQ